MIIIIIIIFKYLVLVDLQGHRYTCIQQRIWVHMRAGSHIPCLQHRLRTSSEMNTTRPQDAKAHEKEYWAGMRQGQVSAGTTS